MFLLILLFAGSLYGMEREVSVIIPNSPRSSQQSDSFNNEQERDDLCGQAIEAVYKSPHLKNVLMPYIQDIIDKESNQPDVNHVGALRRFKSGAIDDMVTSQIHELVARATQQAFQDKDNKIKSRLTKKQATALTTLVGSLTTIIAAIASSYSNRC